MLSCIKTNDFFFLGNTKTKDCFDNKECNRDSNSSESCGTKHTKKL